MYHRPHPGLYVKYQLFFLLLTVQSVLLRIFYSVAVGDYWFNLLSTPFHLKGMEQNLTKIEGKEVK